MSNGLRVAVNDCRTDGFSWYTALARLPAARIFRSEGWLQHPRASRCVQGLQASTVTTQNCRFEPYAHSPGRVRL